MVSATSYLFVNQTKNFGSLTCDNKNMQDKRFNDKKAIPKYFLSSAER